MKTLTKPRAVALGTLSVLAATTFIGVSATPVEAKSKTWKKVAIGAGAVTAYGLIKGNKKVATIGGIATAGSYLKYRHDKKKENRNRNRWRRR